LGGGAAVVALVVLLVAQAVKVQPVSVMRLAWTIGLLSLLAKAALALRDIAMAHWGGVGHGVDLFQLLFAMTAFVHAGLGAAVGMVLVPLLAAKEGQARQDLIAACEGWLIVGGGLLGGSLWAATAATRMFGQIPAGEASAGPLWAAAAMCGCVPLLLLSGAYTARLQLAGRVGYVLVEALPSLFAILQMAFIGDFALTGFCEAILAGTVLQVLVLGWMAGRLDGAICPRPGQLRGLGVSSAMGWTLLSQLIISLQQVVDPWLASHFGAGEIARLSYGTRIVNMGMTLMLTVIARVLLPRLSLLWVRGESLQAMALAQGFARKAGALGCVVCIVCWLGSETIVRLVFFHARFSPDDRAAVAGVLAYGALALAPCWAGLVWLQLATARRLYRAICLGSALGLVAKYGAVAVLIAPLGIKALPAGTAVWQAVVLVVYRLAIGGQWPGRQARASETAGHAP
jgi:peptidoglycan biosynthesis protein MviN/MurJ (putative lipid II flippase)